MSCPSANRPEANKISLQQFLSFPDGFLWGAAISHFQVEGHPLEISKRASDWAVWTVTDGKISDQTTADQACEFHKRFNADIEICRNLNLNAFRISLNWAALCHHQTQPSSGELTLDPDGVKYYREILSSLRNSGMKTFVTLFHFCLPLWLSDEGGWGSEITVREFAKFAEAAAKAFGDLVDYWLTINEPLAYVYQGYVAGNWPPGHRGDYITAFKCLRHMLEGHAQAYWALHKECPSAEVSFTMHCRPFRAKKIWHPLDQMVKYYRDYVFNHMFPLAVQTGELRFPFPLNMKKEVQKLSGVVPGLKGTMDWLAVNYYTRELCKFAYRWPIEIFGEASDEFELDVNNLGWESYPDGLYHLLTHDLLPYKYTAEGKVRPMIITENGFATIFPAHLTEGDWSLVDDLRVQYLMSHLMAVHEAIQDGANVTGYLYWSLLDNFEWAEGLSLRFGLVRVAYPTQKRTPRKSAQVYADIARRNGLDPLITHRISVEF